MVYGRKGKFKKNNNNNLTLFLTHLLVETDTMASLYAR